MLMKTSRILFILMVATVTLNSSANFTYERDSDKWFTAILIGQIGYYGGNC